MATRETGKLDSPLPLSYFLKEHRALSLKGRRELTPTHTLGTTFSLRNLQFFQGGSSPGTPVCKHIVRFSSETT